MVILAIKVAINKILVFSLTIIALSVLLFNLWDTLYNKNKNNSIKCDEYSIHQIFSNLIDNAVKYTASGSVIIELRKDKDNKIEVEVKDTGIGISEDYLQNLFLPFSQEEQGYTRKFDGNGLGLALVKKYCELNNIGISVSSKKGTGTSFTLIFN